MENKIDATITDSVKSLNEIENRDAGQQWADTLTGPQGGPQPDRR